MLFGIPAAIKRPKLIGNLMENTQDTPNFVPRLVGETEAKQLGVAGGWYGTKMSGTFVTGPSASLEACMAAINLLPKPPKAALAPQAETHRAKSIHAMTNAAARSAYQIGRKPYR